MTSPHPLDRERACFRRSRHIVAYWVDGTFVLHNYATNHRISARPLIAAVLDSCGTWSSVRDLAARLHVADESDLAGAIALLEAHGFLLRRGRRPSRAERDMTALGPWNPASGLFHTATRDVPFVEPEAARPWQYARARQRRWSGPVRRYPDAPIARLPRPARCGSWGDTLRQRRTWRQFATGAIRQRDLSSLLWLTAGVQHRVHLEGQGQFVYRTSPSGGALHPIELYVAVRDVHGVEPGLYHYAGDDHVLERLEALPAKPSLLRYLPSQPWFEQAAVVVFFAALMERSLWRYPYARAYRSLLIEAGHLCQTFCLTATHLGLAPFSTMALADSHIDTDFGLNGITESALYAAGACLKPAGKRLAMAPANFKQPKLQANRPRR